MADLAKLVVKLEAQSAQFQKGLDDATRKLRGFQSQTSSTLGVIDRNFKKFAAGITVVAVTAFIKKSIDAADEIGKLAQKTGIGTAALSELQYAAKLSNVSIEEFQTGLRNLSKAVAEAGVNGSDTARSLLALGVSLEKFTAPATTNEERLLALVDAFSQFEDGQGKVNAALAIFGKSGEALIPFLNEGPAGIKRLREEAVRLGVSLDQATADAADRFNDSLDRLKAAASGAGLAVAKAFLPHMEELSKTVADPQFQAKLKDVADGIATIAEAAFKAVEKVAQFANAMKFIGEAIAASLHGAAVGDMVRIMDDLVKAQETLRIAQEKGYGQTYLNTLRAEVKELERKRDLTLAGQKIQTYGMDDHKNIPTPGPTPGDDKKGKKGQLKVEDKDAQTKRDAALKALKELQEYAQEVDVKTAQSIQNIAIQMAEATGENISAVMAKFDAENAELIAHLTQAWTGSLSAVQMSALGQVAALRKVTAEQAIAIELQTKASEITDAIAAKEAEIKLQQDLGAIGATEAIAKVNAAREEERAKLEEIATLLASIASMSEDPRIAQAAEKLTASIKQIVPEVTEAQKQMMELRDGFSDVFGNFLEDLANGKNAWKSFLDDIVSMLLRAGINKLMQQAFGAGGGSGDYGWVGQIAGLLATRASGGPVSANEPYWVGERGPEMFVPGAAGRIVPSEKSMGGGIVINMPIYGVTDADSFKRSEAQILARASSALQRAQRNR